MTISSYKKNLLTLDEPFEKAAYIFMLQLKHKVTLEWDGDEVLATIDGQSFGKPKFYPSSKVMDAILNVIERSEVAENV
jgi:hypothetical protein